MQRVLLEQDDGVKLKVNLKRKGNESILSVNGREYRSYSYFESLIKLRQELDVLGIKLLCNGARYDVYPSRMSLQMGNGRKAYKLTMRKQTSNLDFVDIFGAAPVEKIGTVLEQKSYYQKWLASLG